MDEHLHNQVDKLFLDSLQSHRDERSMEIWDKIESQLDKEDNIIYKARTQRLILITMVIFILITGSVTFTIFYNQANKNISAKSIHLKNSDSPINGTGQAKQNQAGNFLLNAKQKHNVTGKNKIISGNNTNPPNNTFLEIERSTRDSSNDPGTNEFSTLTFFPLNIAASVLKIFAVQPEKTGSKLTRDIPESLIIKPGKQSFKNRLSVTPYFSQEFAGYSLTDDDATAADGQEIEEKERNVFSASVGVYLNYRINKRWVIQSGISYSWSSSVIDSSKSFAVKDNSGNVQFKLNTISGYGYLQTTSPVQPAVGDSVFTAKAYSQLHYLTVPFILSYKIPLNRFSLLLGAGASINFLTGAMVETNIYGSNFRVDGSAIPMKGLKNVNLGLLIKADLEYHINSTWGINLIPCFKNSLSPINIHSALSAYPYNFGIGAGISYRF
jgi:Outer membrane protein beta-barrel domain